MDIQHDHAQQQYKIERQQERQRCRSHIADYVVARSASQIILHTLVLGPFLFGLFTISNKFLGYPCPGWLNFLGSFLFALIVVLAIRNSAKIYQRIN